MSDALTILEMSTDTGLLGFACEGIATHKDVRKEI